MRVCPMTHTLSAETSQGVSRDTISTNHSRAHRYVMLSENGSTSTRPMKRAAAATTPSPSQPTAAKEVWGTLVLQMNADDTQTFELKEDKVHLICRKPGPIGRGWPTARGSLGHPLALSHLVHKAS